MESARVYKPDGKKSFTPIVRCLFFRGSENFSNRTFFSHYEILCRSAKSCSSAGEARDLSLYEGVYVYSKSMLALWCYSDDIALLRCLETRGAEWPNIIWKYSYEELLHIALFSTGSLCDALWLSDTSHEFSLRFQFMKRFLSAGLSFNACERKMIVLAWVEAIKSEKIGCKPVKKVDRYVMNLITHSHCASKWLNLLSPTII